MTVARPAATKGQMLKDTLELLFHNPAQFDLSPLCHPKTLKRLLGERYESLVGEGLHSCDLAVEGLKRLVLGLFREAIQQDDVHLAEGLVLSWHQYLEPIHSGSARSIPPVARVLAYCAQPGNLREFWRVADSFDKVSKHTGSSQANGLFGDVSSNGSVDQHRVAAQKQRRTYANYIQRAFEALARATELAGLFETGDVVSAVEVNEVNQTTLIVETQSEVADHPVARSSALAAVTAYVLEKCAHLPPACGRALRISSAIERTVEVRSVKGEPLWPGALPVGADDVKRMSGVVAGVPGSGRTSLLYQVAYSSARAWAYGQPLAIYIRAPEFLIYARNRRSIHEFTARQIFPSGSRDAIESLRKELEEYEQSSGVLWLVDDVDRLSESDQSEVIMQLAFSPAALYAAAPWEADRIARQICQPDVGVFRLVELSEEQQKEMLARLLAQHPEANVDIRMSHLALREVPYLSKLPLGVMTVYDQLLTNIADRVHVAQRAMEEYFERAGLSRPQFTGEWLTLDPTVRALLVMATVTGADILWVKEADIFTTRARFEQGNGWTQDCQWELLGRSRLFEPHPQREDACRFFNWDILGYLIAHSEVGQLYLHAQVNPQNLPSPLMKFVFHTKRYVSTYAGVGCLIQLPPLFYSIQ